MCEVSKISRNVECLLTGVFLLTNVKHCSQYCTADSDCHLFTTIHCIYREILYMLSLYWHEPKLGLVTLMRKNSNWYNEHFVGAKSICLRNEVPQMLEQDHENHQYAIWKRLWDKNWSSERWKIWLSDFASIRNYGTSDLRLCTIPPKYEERTFLLQGTCVSAKSSPAQQHSSKVLSANEN